MLIKQLTLVLLLFLVGCTTDSYMSYCYRMTESGYPAVHRNDYVLRNTPTPSICRQGGDYCTHKCHHIKEPTYRYIFIPPIYKPVFLGVDGEGRDIYERMLITGGHYEKVFAGYYCYICGAKL